VSATGQTFVILLDNGGGSPLVGSACAHAGGGLNGYIVITANDPPTLFKSSASWVRLDWDQGQEAKLEVLDKARIRGILSRCCRFSISRGESIREIAPPIELVADMQVNLSQHLPPLNRIVRTPIFLPDGQLISEPGYYADSGTFYAEPEDLVGLSIPSHPSEDDVVQARTLILDELFGDFPFGSDTDRSHAVALLLLPFVRTMIDGPTPLHLIEAAKQGTGKGLLAEVISIICQGKTPEVATLADEESEISKSLTSSLLAKRQFIVYDELSHLHSRHLASALTAQTWSARILGASTMVDLPIEAVWIGLGNNVSYSGDFRRRIVRCRLVSPLEEPWKRTGFRHQNLSKWVRVNRRNLVWACLVLIRYGLCQKNTKKRVPLGSYEQWTAVVGQILDGCGIEGFLAMVDDLDDICDTNQQVWGGIVASWWATFGDRPVRATEIYEEVVRDLDVELDLKGRTEQALATEFGIRLRQQRDSVYGDYQIKYVGRGKRVNLWKLVPLLTRGEPGEPGEPPSSLKKQTEKNGGYPYSEAVCSSPLEESQVIRGSPGSPPSPEQISIVFHNGAWRVCSSETGYPLSQSLHKSREAAETEAQLLVTRGAAWD
jgi:hypothetical protein